MSRYPTHHFRVHLNAIHNVEKIMFANVSGQDFVIFCTIMSYNMAVHHPMI